EAGAAAAPPSDGTCPRGPPCRRAPWTGRGSRGRPRGPSGAGSRGPGTANPNWSAGASRTPLVDPTHPPNGMLAAVRAVQITELSGPDSALQLADVPEPEASHMLTPGSGVVVDVHAAGVSFPEVLQTRGEYQVKPELPFIPASEVVRSDAEWKDQVKELGGADVVIDPVGGDRFLDSVRSLKQDGRLVVVGFTGGSIPEVKVNRLLLNNTEVVGAGWGAYVMGK